ncbi:alpha/beta hydrolase family protein [Sphingopyxis sp.]|uniref:alpha/beta hydrolase family protein n=1 Tax=Sphingopyxis sp. TaxID=1908224 RepID=UPI003D6D2078
MSGIEFARRGAVAIALLLASATTAAAAPPAKAPREGELSTHVNLDARDSETKLEIIQHELFAAQQQAVRIEFMLRYGDAVTMDYIYYPSGSDLIPGYVFRAKDGPTKATVGRMPAIVLVHGGFHERLSPQWFKMIAELVAGGYLVMFPEYRGSRGYGENHYQNDYGVTDTADVLAASDYLTRRPDVDADRLAIIGESRGGMVTLLAIEQEPKRFKAAVDIVGLTDFVAYMAYKPEYRRQEVARQSPSLGGKLPNENLAAYMAISPINAVDRIETPLLVLATTGDKIAPLTLHTGRLLDALKARDKVYDSKIYENAPGGHVFMHGDQPERADAMARIFAWLGRYIGSPPAKN